MKRSARLFAILARESSQAVVFRRGPSKQVLLLRWNTATDEIEEGQWLKGRIYERRSDLSPDGRLLIYFAGNQKPPYGTWTAVSRPPWLTALALWPKGDTWGGGGMFGSNTEILLNHGSCNTELADGFELPAWMNVSPLEYTARWTEEPVWAERLVRDGWIRTSAGQLSEHDHGVKMTWAYDPPIIWEKRRDPYTLQMKILGFHEKEGPWYVSSYDVIERASGRTFALGRSDWAEWDHSGDLVFEKEGCLYRGVENPKLVADLNDRKFENRQAPPQFVKWPTKSRAS